MVNTNLTAKVKEKKVMITTQTKINAFTVKTIVFNESQKFNASEMQIENILICQSDQEFDDNDTDEEYLNMNYTDELNVLTVILYSDKQKDKVLSSTLEKRKKVIEE